MTSAHDPGSCEIRVQGHLDERWATWFEGMTIEAEAAGVTLLHGWVADQSALHGLLTRLRDLGVPLISVAFDPAPGLPSRTAPPSGKATDHGRHRDHHEHHEHPEDGSAV